MHRQTYHITVNDSYNLPERTLNGVRRVARIGRSARYGSELGA